MADPNGLIPEIDRGGLIDILNSGHATKAGTCRRPSFRGGDIIEGQ